MHLRASGQAPNDSARPRLRLGAAVLVAMILALALSLSPLGDDSPQRAQAKGQKRPNIVLLFTDDQEPRSMRVMKKVRREMAKKGTTMDHFYTNFPLCCPSRATMLTGQYAHNHRVLSNTAPDGGYGVFNELHGNNYLPLWLQSAGYRTGYIGKFLNEYAEPDDYGTTPTDVPAGWNDWRALAPSRAQYFGYTLNENGVLNQYTDAERHYSTDVFTAKAKRFIRKHSPGKTPFFLMLGYAAPHGGGGGEPGRSCNRAAVPAPRHLGKLRKRNKKLALPPSFNEADVSDKPEAVRSIDAMTPGQIADVTRKRRCAWESLLAVDESVDAIVEQLKRSGEKRNTYVFFTSDNGYLRGEHRIKNNKRFLYEESARVPLIVRGPGVARGEKSSDVTNNADVVPTILELTGAQPGLTQDGLSLLGSLRNPALENARATLLEAYAGQQIIGLRTARYLYSEWDTSGSAELPGPLPSAPRKPDVELYDNYADPYQLNNLAADPAYAEVVDILSGELDRLIDCDGAECYEHPGGELTVAAAATGRKGCVRGPLTARAATTNDAEVVSVSFRAGRTSLGTDTIAPFEVAVPERPLQKALPDAAEVTAKALFADGRRLGLARNVLACEQR